MTTDTTLTVSRTDPTTISAETTVRHLDELSDSERGRLVKTGDDRPTSSPDCDCTDVPDRTSDAAASTGTAGLAEVIVTFDDYYRLIDDGRSTE